MTWWRCPSCGFKIDPELQTLDEISLEDIVAEDDRIRTLQYQAALAGIEYRHSVSIASNFSVGYGDGDGH